MLIPAFSILLMLSIPFTLWLSLYSWRYRSTPGARLLAFFLVNFLFWEIGSLLSLYASTPERAVFWWVNVRFSSVILFSVTYFGFILEYTGRVHWLSWRRVWVFFLIPLISFIILSQPAWRSFYYVAAAAPYEHVMFVEFTTGPWFMVHVSYNYGLFLFSLALLIRHVKNLHYPYRQQAALIILGLILPFLINIPFTFHLFPDTIPNLDYSALGGISMGITWGWALFYYRLLDIMPIARDAIIDSMADAVLVLDTQNRIIDMNRAMAEVLKLDQKAVTGLSLLDYVGEWPEWAEQIAKEGDAAAEITLPVATETRNYDLSISTLYRRKNKPIGRLIMLHDITTRKQAEQVLAHYNSELEQHNTDLDAFAHTVAHDLKNPLMSVIGYGDLLLDETFGELISDEQRFALNQMVNAGHKMSNIIKELLLFASVRKLEDIEVEPLDMNYILLDVQARLSLMINQYQGTLNLPPAWPIALGYGPWIEEVWANFISNALKYGGTPPTIELGADHLIREEKPFVRYWIKDNGSGLTTEQQEQLFQPFVRLHKIKANGNGLGLSITQRIMTKLGGTVGVESTPTQGSRFYFILPGT